MLSDVSGIGSGDRELSDRKRAEEMAKESELRFKILSEAMPQLVWSGFADGTIDYSNKRWEQYTGMNPHQVDGHGWINGIDAAQEIYNKYHIPSIYLTAYSDEHTFERAKTTEPLAYITKPFRETELYNTIELTLARYKSEMKVKENEQWLFTVLKSIGDAVIISDRHNQIKFMNPVAESLTKWQQSDALERNIAEVFNIINEVNRTSIESPLKQAVEENTVVKIPEENCLLTKNGAEIPIEGTAALIKDHKGNTTGAVWVFRDIIERKKSEAVLRQQTEELERASRLKDEFLAIVSHEIRTPLNAILGWTQLLTKRKVSEVTLLQALATIERNAKAQLIIIEDILDASMIVGGNLRLNTCLVDLWAVINSVIEDMRPQIETKNIQVESIGENFRGAILGDGDRLRQVIGNLLVNALKFTPYGGGV